MFITNPYVTYPQRSSLHRYHFGRRAAIGEKHEHMFLRAIGKAMQYYRIWIYSCNAALFIGTFIYVVAFITVITDSRLSLFPNIRLYHPSFIYAYLAIIIQGGLVQVNNCGHIKSSSYDHSNPIIFHLILNRRSDVLVHLSSMKVIYIYI